MKHSQLIGIIASISLVAICFLPWSYIESKNLVVSGLSAPGTNFGKPGLLNVILTSFNIIFFLIPRVWAKRTNTFFAVLNFAWTIRNFILVSACMMGECPEIKPALYLQLVLAAVILFMTLVPKLSVSPKRQ